MNRECHRRVLAFWMLWTSVLPSRRTYVPKPDGRTAAVRHRCSGGGTTKTHLRHWQCTVKLIPLSRPDGAHRNPRLCSAK